MDSLAMNCMAIATKQAGRIGNFMWRKYAPGHKKQICNPRRPRPSGPTELPGSKAPIFRGLICPGEYCKCMSMKKSLCLLATLIVASAATARAAEFPDSWTWDQDGKIRAEHAALEGKPMPALDLTGWINGELKPS